MCFLRFVVVASLAVVLRKPRVRERQRRIELDGPECGIALLGAQQF